MRNNIEPNYETMSLEELRQAEQRAQAYILRRLETRKREALNQIKELVRVNELSYEDVTGAIRTISKRGKAPALYRNPANPRQTWSGKGEAPEWYTTHPNPKELKIPGS